MLELPERTNSSFPLYEGGGLPPADGSGAW